MNTREIKFRAWNGTRWIYFTLQQLIDGCATNFVKYNLKNWCVCIGKDKNGRTVYTADIVKHQNGLHLVVYDEATASYQFNFSDHVLDQETGFRLSKDAVVVGNLYENPELLEQK